MSTPPPAEIGAPLQEVDTPALLLDLDVLERNLDKMAAFLKGSPAVLRGHAKNHKTPEIARRQMQRGAVGCCCQKVGEAEVMVQGGIGNVLVSNQIVGASKLRRLAALATQAEISVCADDPLHVAGYNEAAGEFGVTLPVLVEIDLGGHRCGVEPGQEALELAKLVDQAAHLEFAGLQAYHGSSQHIRDHGERRQASLAAIEMVRLTVDLLKNNGLECRIVTGGGTGTYALKAHSGVYTEVQAGSYIFMDADYAQNLMEDGRFVDEFEHSLFVYTAVMSRRVPERAIVDAGLKALSVDRGLPTVFGLPGAEFAKAADEHGYLTLHKESQHLKLEDKIRLVPGHCDPQVNLFDWYVCVRKNRVEALWPVAARGRVY